VRLSARISRPVEELARKTRAIDLDRLDADFASDRTDEIGALSRFLGEMTARLRASLTRVQEAERRATLGELARQVNHDLRNAFTPLRNVVRHLTQVAEREPERLPEVFAERRETLEAGLAYVDTLAGSWRRVSTRPQRVPTDLAAVVRRVAAGRRARDGGPVVLALPPGPLAVLADVTGLRRIVENLVANACESLDSETGRVLVSLAPTTTTEGAAAVELRVEDDGVGIPPEELNAVFDDFFTTKPGGSGLGLSVVRRLVSDFEGTVRVESTPGRGTVFTVVLPAAGAGGAAPGAAGEGAS
jgi:signal transduction histidine kinase